MIQIKLSRVLGDKRITQAKLCQMTGLGKHAVNDLYHDITDRVSLSNLDAICEALECPLDEILVWTPNRKDKAKAGTHNNLRQDG